MPLLHRFSARYRHYKYFILQRQAGGGLASLDIERMREAARYFVGEHDFRNFCKVSVMIFNAPPTHMRGSIIMHHLLDSLCVTASRSLMCWRCVASVARS